MQQMNIREFRNNFCKLAEGEEVILVTKREKAIGTYTPQGAAPINMVKESCELNKFQINGCHNHNAKTFKKVMVTYNDNVIEATLCEKHLKDLLVDSETNPNVKVEVL